MQQMNHQCTETLEKINKLKQKPLTCSKMSIAFGSSDNNTLALKMKSPVAI
jgi:hypothetical protein